MRGFVLLVSLFSGFTAIAQNWALLNPAYRYNYSNDGTDTIRHQIYVIGVDTVGPDTFRYELNRTAQYCPQCGPGCEMKLRIPQFMMGRCDITNGVWTFTDTASRVVRANAALGNQWTFDLAVGTQAVLVEVSEEVVLGTLDSVRTLVSELNDTIRWTKGLGILLWHMHNEPRFQLIGVQGPNVGVRVPTIAEFFRYQPGDIVQFREAFDFNAAPGLKHRRFQVSERIETADGLVFHGYAHERYRVDWGQWWYSSGNYTWLVDTLHMPELRALYAAPEAVVSLGSDGNFHPAVVAMIASHYRDEEGYYSIVSRWLGQYSLFYLTDTAQSACGAIPEGNSGGLSLNNLLGESYFGMGGMGSWPPNYWSQNIIGAIISGDTIGTVYDHHAYVGMDETTQNLGPLHPNPAADWIYVPRLSRAGEIAILDAQGRVVKNCLAANPSERIDVRALPAGVYVVISEGLSPQRLIIAR